MVKALVIGSEGNVGKPLVEYLYSKQYEVLEADIKPGWKSNYYVSDINHPIDLLPAFDSNPDVVFLLSAMVSRVTCEQASSLAIATNLSGINNVIQLCKRTNSRLVYFSTSEVYGPECNPMDESNSNPNPNNRYGLSKYLGEKLIEYEVRSHGLKAVTIRPFMIYDENEEFGEYRSAMIRFACNLATGKPVEVHQGSARGWLHISDAAKAIEKAAHLNEYSVINIGHPEIKSILSLANMIKEQLEAPSSLIKEIEIPQRMTSIKNPTLKRQTELLEVTPKIGLDEGVSKVCSKVLERLKNGKSIS
ncbi:MAG: NAD(P)-dependent oxidoreductase [SAR202 cluster bacterium]|nr:NAD(P)-dependent oxidoreductase [SAR202 cluster bacterium]|tara:strand:- start:1329 stop:2243 length:915 start_codon:yes stop_codon:yes gene_type:complete